MALRFQAKDDCDLAAMEKGGTAELVIFLVILAVIDGIYAFFRSESLASYGKSLAWPFGFGFVLWMVIPVYYEFRFRAKETYGKVSAIEDALIDAKDGHVELLERLAAIEDKLDAIQRELLSRGEATR